ncbi:mitofusin [Irineochytrium annulatum]|nr:mitofusin [Irineochytrium annulatum]
MQASVKPVPSQPPSVVGGSVAKATSAAKANHQVNGSAHTAAFTEKRAKLLSLIPTVRTILDDLNGGPNDLLQYPTDDDPLSILQLNLSAYKYSSSSASSLNSGVGEGDSYVTQLLHLKIQESHAHLDRLQTRISDIRSRVLVTGDLNAGKSTFVNALLRREVVPDDQQPCTALFCEVVDAEQNDGVEEVHGIKDNELYNRLDAATFVRCEIAQLRGIVEDNPDGFELLKVYCRDNRPKAESLLHNGHVDISLIDSPGLNIDSMKTTSLFAQQEEIDVIVFVVNSENHFTLSGRQFLKTAGKEKAYIFIVVNRFDQIRRKDRCKRDILDQIKEISPLTYENVDHLVHFVSARLTLQGTADEASASDFATLEENLRSFILEKRARSKLAPAKIYVQNLLSDVIYLCESNCRRAETKSDEISKTLIEDAPAFEAMLRIKEEFLDDIEVTIDETGDSCAAFARDQLSAFMSHVETYVEDFEWPGFFGVWKYARDLRNSIYKLAAIRLKKCEDAARNKASECVKRIQELSSQCMEEPPVINMSAVNGAFEDGSQEAGRAAAANMFVPLELNDFFEFTDKVEVAKAYLPSFSLIATGIVGFQRVTAGHWRFGSVMASVGTARSIFAALALAGVGLFSYVLSDMKDVVDRKVVGKLQQHLSRAGFMEANSARIGKGIKRVLRLAIWDFENQFQRILGESQKKRENQTRMRVAAELAKDTFKELATRATTVQNMVTDVDL